MVGKRDEIHQKVLIQMIIFKKIIFLNISSNKQKATLSEYNIIKKSNLFDEKYYLQTYPDVKNANVEAVKHFMEFGWKEGRNPSDRFDTNFYLETYKDIKEANINPLIHYIKYGKKELLEKIDNCK
jgi:hypothetical protein